MKNLPGGQMMTTTTASEIETPAKATRMLLRMVRATQPISRIELAGRLGDNRSTVTDIFKPLIAAGILREAAFKTASDTNRLQGRPPIGLSFDSDRDFFVGVNLGVRHSQVGLTTLSGEILAEDVFETPATPAEALLRIQKSIKNLRANISGRKLKIIGVSVPARSCR